MKDIYPGASPSNPSDLIHFNGALYFAADDGINGKELWMTDGTDAGTVMVRDIIPGPTGSSPASLVNVDGTLFFSAIDGAYRDLWRSDGTEAGTARVKDNDFISGPGLLTAAGGTLYFTAYDIAYGDELWKSDGTESGTVLVKNIASAGTGSYPGDLTDLNGILYFTADDGTSGEELWKSDGTSTGTVMVKNIRATGGSNPGQFTVVNGTLYFSADDGVNGRELWKSDGTAAGTVLVENIAPGSVGSAPSELVDVNGTLFFAVAVGGGRALWKSDGTEAGTVVLREAFGATSIAHLTNFNGMLFLNAVDGTHGGELWKSDGTSVGTMLVKDIRPGSSNSGIEHITNVNGTLLLSASDGVNGKELWRSDGTEAGTALVMDIFSGASSSFPRNFTATDRHVYFPAEDGQGGQELWVMAIPSMDPWTSLWHHDREVYPNASCPWTLFDTASPEAPVLSANDLTLATSEISENLYYEQSDYLVIPDTLLIRARFRVDSESHLEGNPRRGVGIQFAVAPDSANFLFVGRDTVFLWSAFAQQGATAFVDTDGGFHTYDIRVVNRSAVAVLQDGAPILNGAIVGTGGNITEPTLAWGDLTLSSSAISRWEFFLHNANTIPCGTAPVSVPRGPAHAGRSEHSVSLVSYPNPARGTMTFAMLAPVRLNAPATVRIYDVTGRLVKSMDVPLVSQGLTRVNWDATDQSGTAVSSGTYLAVLSVAGRSHDSIKTTILR